MGFQPSVEELASQFAVVTALIRTEGLEPYHALQDVYAGDKVHVTFKIVNTTQVDWQPDTVLQNDFSDGSIKPYPFVIKRRRVVFLKMLFKVPDMCDAQKLTVRFWLMTT